MVQNLVRPLTSSHKNNKKELHTGVWDWVSAEKEVFGEHMFSSSSFISEIRAKSAAGSREESRGSYELMSWPPLYFFFISNFSLTSIHLPTNKMKIILNLISWNLRSHFLAFFALNSTRRLCSLEYCPWRRTAHCYMARLSLSLSGLWGGEADRSWTEEKKKINTSASDVVDEESQVKNYVFLFWIFRVSNTG